MATLTDLFKSSTLLFYRGDPMVYLKKKYYFPVGRESNIFQGGGPIAISYGKLHV